MKITKYYLFVFFGLLALILTFLIKVRTPVGIFNEYLLISKIQWNDNIPESWHVYSYIITYYLFRIGIIIALLISPRRVIILSVLLLFSLSTVTSYIIFLGDSKLVSMTYIPYIISVVIWLYLGLTMPKEQN